MGCCASADYKAASAPEQHRRLSAATSDNHHPKVAPPPEEETVKEVLSETPAPKPNISKIEDEETRKGYFPALQKIQEENDNGEKKTPLMTAEEVSEFSDICSLNDSVSTVTVTEKTEDDDGEVLQRTNRSPAKFRNRSFPRERSTTAGKSPARRSEPSPGRVRYVPSTERRALVADGQKRDARDSSGRRSRSPATRANETGALRSGLGRSPSVRKTGKSPGRARSELPDKTRKVEETNQEMMTTKWLPPTKNESLENPLVSLECFIFL